MAIIGLGSLAEAHGRWRAIDARMLGSDRLEVYERGAAEAAPHVHRDRHRHRQRSRPSKHAATCASRIACGYDTATIDLGASIACSGVCLTVVDKGTGWFAVDISAETVSREPRKRLWTAGLRLNLERALKVGDELGGHIVTGHVDAVGIVLGVCA